MPLVDDAGASPPVRHKNFTQANKQMEKKNHYAVALATLILFAAPQAAFPYLRYSGEEEPPPTAKPQESPTAAPEADPSAKAPPVTEAPPPSPAHAPDSSPETAGKEAAPCRGRLSESGRRPARLEKVRTSGDAVPLSEAAMKVVPAGWRVLPGAGVSSEPVTWSKKADFAETLAFLSDLSGTCMALDWGEKTVTLGGGQGQGALADAVPPALEPPQESPQASAPPAAEPAPPLPPPPPEEETWTLEEGQMLSANLDAWAKKAGWSVVWGVKGLDFRVTHTAVLGGKFLDALEKVLQAYEDTPNPIEAKVFKGNHVVQIVEHVPYNRYVRPEERP